MATTLDPSRQGISPFGFNGHNRHTGHVVSAETFNDTTQQTSATNRQDDNIRQESPGHLDGDETVLCLADHFETGAAFNHVA